MVCAHCSNKKEYFRTKLVLGRSYPNSHYYWKCNRMNKRIEDINTVQKWCPLKGAKNAKSTTKTSR